MTREERDEHMHRAEREMTEEQRAIADDINNLKAEFFPRASGPSQSRIENYRREIPKVIAGMTQIVVDNPAQFGLAFAGMIVISRAAFNIVKPRTPLQALALAVVLQVGLPALATRAVEQGWLRLRVRDENGCLVPLVITDDPGQDPQA